MARADHPSLGQNHAKTYGTGARGNAANDAQECGRPHGMPSAAFSIARSESPF
eukprot:COSAG01_NODE_2246_length_8080_cov_4.007017_6_plen_53_part_00